MADSEDEGLKAAIAMSLEHSRDDVVPNHTFSNVASQEHEKMPNGDSGTSTKPATGFASLDRKAMEAERLARLSRKRERSISPPILGSRKAPKLEANTVTLPSGAKLTSFANLVNQDQRDRKSVNANAANEHLKQIHTAASVKQELSDDVPLEISSSSQGSLMYPNGVVKRTWAFGFERTKNDVKLEEVLEASTLRTAVLSAFQWNIEWLLPKLKTPAHGGTTKCIFVMQAKTDEERQQYLRESADMRSFLRLCFPPMYAPINCMHSKLMLLFHESKLRIAIPTANLLNFDWGETSVMENSVFMIDLPRLPHGESNELTDFGKELNYFLEKQRVDRDVRDGLLNFDFNATQGMRFIHTAGGTHYSEDAERTGLPGLARAVRQLNLESREDLQLDFAASSIGSLNDEYLRSFHSAARGEDTLLRVASANQSAKADFFKPASKPPNGSMSIRDKIRIYFPTHDTVTASRAGAAGTICLNRKWFESGTFPRTTFRDYRSTRSGLLSHNKILYARGTSNGEIRKNVAWAYVGSANMSESAWGKVVYDKKEKAAKVSCRNWECGVLLQVPEEKLLPAKKEKVEGEDSETESEDESTSIGSTANADKVVGIDVFKDVVEPPFEIPGQRYGGQQPWYFLESKD